MIVGFAVRNGLKVHQLDVTTAFLNGKLDEDVYMHQPEGYTTEGSSNLVCKLKRSMYGLKQSPRCWNAVNDEYLKELGFLQSNSDPCVYIDVVGEMAVVGVYVDDFVFAFKSQGKLKKFQRSLCARFDVKILGKLRHSLGLKVCQDETSGDVWLGQSGYVNDVLVKFGMQDAKSVVSPVDTSTKLVSVTDEDVLFDQRMYRSAIGKLLYLSTSTRPDIAFAIGNVAKIL